MVTKEVMLSDEVEVINQARAQCTSWSADRSLGIDVGFFGFLWSWCGPIFKKIPAPAGTRTKLVLLWTLVR